MKIKVEKGTLWRLKIQPSAQRSTRTNFKVKLCGLEPQGFPRQK